MRSEVQRPPFAPHPSPLERHASRKHEEARGSTRKHEEALIFEYTPATPATSSSGVYSGGQGWRGTLDDEHVAELWRWLVRLTADPSLQTDTRMKGAGFFSVETGSGSGRFLIKSCPLLREFDALLKPLRRGE